MNIPCPVHDRTATCPSCHVAFIRRLPGQTHCRKPKCIRAEERARVEQRRETEREAAK